MTPIIRAARLCALLLALVVLPLSGCRVEGEIDPDFGRNDADEDYYGAAGVPTVR
jgi:hypothetical protein